MFTDPRPTPYDLRFRILGMPVRIHPLFWLIALFLAPRWEGVDPVPILLCWIAAMLTGILVHELGHAVVQKYVYGAKPWIVLYAFGGLACCDTWAWRRQPGTWGSILISLAGPLAGFLLVGLLVCIAFVSGTPVFLRFIHFFDVPLIPIPSFAFPIGDYASLSIGFLVLISVFWGVFNLLPIYPLDGGNICRELCLWFSSRRGIVVSLWISVFTAGAMGVYFFSQWIAAEEKTFPWNTILMAYLTFQSWRMLEYHGRGYR